MGKRLSTWFIILLFLTGLSLLLYPSVSNYVNSKNQSRAIAEYAEDVEGINDKKYEQIIQEAVDYNKKLAQKGTNWDLSNDELDEYNQVLNINGNGMMGYIEIPKLQISVPVYHSTDEGVLQKNIGHLPGSSLPVGGESTHAVLSGHRGLPSAKLFSELDTMTEGDKFIFRILNETLTYEVDQISVVLPDEMNSLQIEEGKDLCTLVTCTPYGVNSHRLFVRGHRVENDPEPDDTDNAKAAEDTTPAKPIIAAVIMAGTVSLLLVIRVLVRRKKKTK